MSEKSRPGDTVTGPKAALLSDGLLPIGKAAEFTGLSRTRIYELMGEGRLSFTKIGKRRLIPKRSLIKLAEERLEIAPREVAH